MRFYARFRISAIVAALALCASAALMGCGNRGGLYLPTVPPMPQRPAFDDTPQGAHAASGAGVSGPLDRSDTSGVPLSLMPDTELGASSPATAQPASGTDVPVSPVVPAASATSVVPASQ